MSDTTQNPDQDSDSAATGSDDDRHIPSADQDVASGQPYDPRKDPDTDPDLVQEKAPSGVGENQRDPAEGPDDESATNE